MKLSFYVDECLPLWLAAAVSAKRGYRAVHAKADLGYGGRSDEFHFETARKRRQILLTKNRQDFGADRRLLRGHPGVVALVPGDQSNAESVLRARLDEMYACFERNRVGAKPPSGSSWRSVVSPSAATAATSRPPTASETGTSSSV